MFFLSCSKHATWRLLSRPLLVSFAKAQRVTLHIRNRKMSHLRALIYAFAYFIKSSATDLSTRRVNFLKPLSLPSLSFFQYNIYFSQACKVYPLHKKWSFPLRVSSVINVTKSAEKCGFGQLLKKSIMENFIFCTLILKHKM